MPCLALIDSTGYYKQRVQPISSDTDILRYSDYRLQRVKEAHLKTLSQFGKKALPNLSSPLK